MSPERHTSSTSSDVCRPKPSDARAADTIAQWALCWRAKLKAAGRGPQNAEMLLVSKQDGELCFDDLGGWAGRNASMERIIRAADALDGEPPLPDFKEVVVQTGDRCVVRRRRREAAGTTEDVEHLELHLWQNQPLSAERRVSLPLERVLSMCSAPSYADIAVPDWACDAWVEAGLGARGYDETCAELAAAAAAPAVDARACWFGTTHHHPCRMRLLQLAEEHPDLLVCNNVSWTQAELAAGARAEPTAGAAAGAFLPMAEQVRLFGLSVDVQGKGYSSRVKFLLHAGRPLLLAKRPWVEHYHAQLVAWEHFIPVREDLADLPERVRWAHTHTDEAARIGANGQAFARVHLTHVALLHEWRRVLLRLSEARCTAIS